jgi:hypothetical protein
MNVKKTQTHFCGSPKGLLTVSNNGTSSRHLFRQLGSEEARKSG